MDFSNMMIDIGNGNMALSSRITQIIAPNSETIRKVKKDARENKVLIDACGGKVARSVIFFDSDHIAVSPVEKRKLTHLRRALKPRPVA